jgi:hypothetical protein
MRLTRSEAEEIYNRVMASASGPEYENPSATISMTCHPRRGEVTIVKDDEGEIVVLLTCSVCGGAVLEFILGEFQ